MKLISDVQPVICRSLDHDITTSYDSVLVIVGRLMKMIHYKPAQITINAPTLAAGYTPLSLTAVTAHTSSMRTSNRDLMTACRKNLLHGLDIANPFSPNLSGYVHGFGYQPKGLTALLAHYDPLKAWQISLC